ncbi:hypothetical protein RYX36_035697 [Vicia faba]
MQVLYFVKDIASRLKAAVNDASTLVDIYYTIGSLVLIKVANSNVIFVYYVPLCFFSPFDLPFLLCVHFFRESGSTVTAATGGDSLFEKIPAKLHFDESSSDSDSDSHSESVKPEISSVKDKVQINKLYFKSGKSRSSSPFRQLSSTSYTSRGSACKETGHVPHQNSIKAAEYSLDNVRGCDNLNISGNDKPGDAGRRRSSPLRRLLDPLLKPKTAKFSRSLDSSQKFSLSINKNYRSANGRFSTLHPIKEVDRDHKAGCSAINTIDSSREMKHAPSTTQALLRIAVKNGLPLFTFAVNQIDGNILAAKVKNLGDSGKDECNRIYTFLTFSEVKKKNGSWMSKAGRSKEPDYVPHVVAQMKASYLHYYDLTGQNCMDSSTVKEFVLFSVKLGQSDAQDADYQPKDELAAIAVKIPKAISFINNQHHSSCHSDSHDIVHATVVLPGGVHSFPSKGGPSSLLERWKSGGSCDCGGWDLACKLKIIATDNQASRKPLSSKPYFADYQFDLFVQISNFGASLFLLTTGEQTRFVPSIQLNPLENGMSSVAFDSSLSLLQAFAICIALVDSKMPCELSGTRKSQTEELKAFGKLEDIPTSYVSNPPVSPVGRV